ncbi:hypothetical protein TcWFU_009470 [Taenia crassiceps]|uniref:ribose-5-phosphate isomerase n=1 Tax=Taenia crassiceps TaxID=6207 RepID=A0ABR4QU08_9CEST
MFSFGDNANANEPDFAIMHVPPLGVPPMPNCECPVCKNKISDAVSIENHFLEYLPFCRPIANYLLADCDIPKYYTVLDIVTPESRKSACFTKGYGHRFEGTGSFLEVHQSPKGESKFYPKIRAFHSKEIARLLCFPEYFEFPKETTNLVKAEMLRPASIIGGAIEISLRRFFSSIGGKSEPMPNVEAGKKCAAYKAVDEWLKDEQIVGIGSGTTVVYAVERMGGGGCLIQERIVDANAKYFIAVADEGKLSKYLGEHWSRGLPIEVIPMAVTPVKLEIENRFGGKVDIRMGVSKMGPVISDNGNFIVDWKFEPSPSIDWHQVNMELHMIPGVVGTGLFLGTAHQAYLGKADGSVLVMKNSSA